MQRTLEPELLDSLPHHHPDALHNRRDLRLTNRIAGNHRWILDTLPRWLQPGERVLEIGAGTGELGRELISRGVAVDALDLWPRPPDWPAAAAWQVADLRAFDGYHRYAGIVGNLIFHQFAGDELRALGDRLRDTAGVVIACEPARRRFSQLLFRVAGPLLGANHVSMHDAHVSIAAGFRGEELPRALGLSHEAWNVHTHTTVLGMYRMIAVARATCPRLGISSASPRGQVARATRSP